MHEEFKSSEADVYYSKVIHSQSSSDVGQPIKDLIRFANGAPALVISSSSLQESSLKILSDHLLQLNQQQRCLASQKPITFPQKVQRLMSQRSSREISRRSFAEVDAEKSFMRLVSAVRRAKCIVADQKQAQQRLQDKDLLQSSFALKHRNVVLIHKDEDAPTPFEPILKQRMEAALERSFYQTPIAR